jgi:hypothetical protein
VGQKTLWLMSPRWLRSGDDGNWKLILLTTLLSKTLSLGSVMKKVYFFTLLVKMQMNLPIP